MVPDKMKAVLRDFRSGKASSAAELAKLHGVSRSAVYRLLKKEAETAPEQQKETQRPDREVEDGEEKGESLIDHLYTRAEQFANALGLPDEAGKVKNEEVKDVKAEQEKEEQLEAMMDIMLGNKPQGLALPEGLEAAISGPPSKQVPYASSASPINIRREVNDEAPAPRVVEAKRAELTQKIIFNVQHFGSQLEVITGPNREAFLQSLAAMPVPHLKETLTILERTRSVGNIANGFKHLFYVAGQATETASSFIGMNSQGFTAQLRAQDEEVTMIMKELAIEQWERLKVMDSPQVRLGMLFCMTLVQVDSRNRMEAHFKQAEVPEHIAKNSVDL